MPVNGAEARSLLEPMAESHLTPRICMLMAELEEGEKNDFGLVRQWLARAVGAHRDPAWTADGQVSESWQPISPVTGKIDAYEWKVPVREAAHAEQPLLDSSELDEASEKDMVLISSEKSDADSKAKGFDVSQDDIEEINPEDAVVDAPAEKAEEPSERIEEPVKVDEPVVSDEAVVAEATKPEPVDAEAALEPEKAESDTAEAEEEVSAEKVSEKAAIEKPKEVEFPMPFPPDDPGPKKGETARKPEKRFKLF